MSNTNASSLKFTAIRVQQLIASRALLRNSQIGETVRFHIVGNGTLIPVKTKDGAQVMSANDGSPLYKTIYNVKANSQLAIQNDRNKEILKGAFETEQSGDDMAAHAAYNDYLNKIQVSFSVINNPGRVGVQFYDKQLVEGEVELITTERGQLLTITNVRPVAVEKLKAMPAFSLADLMGLDEKKTPTVNDVFTEDNKVITEKAD
jgi:hypothetical protein